MSTESTRPSTRRSWAIARRDILDELKEAQNNGMRPGTADSDVNVLALPVQITYGLLYLAIKEIEKLRMAQTAGPSFREIKQEIKDAPL